MPVAQPSLSSSRGARRLVAATVSLVLTVGALTLGVGGRVGNASVPASTAAAANSTVKVNGTVKGLVFQDFGSTGFFTTGNAATGEPRNRPIGGITATAYDADGDRVGTATSGSDGAYTINISGAKSNYLRVQFSGWDPSVYQPGFAAQTAIPANSKGENDTSVQFTELGTRRKPRTSTSVWSSPTR